MRISVSPYIASRIVRPKGSFRIDYFCTGGPGGQNQNRNKNGVRLVDKITGISAESRAYKSQKQNKTAAFQKVCERLIEHYHQEEMELNKKGIECQKAIRTYKEKNDLVLDSRSNKVYSYKKVLDGDLSELIEDIKLNASNES